MLRQFEREFAFAREDAPKINPRAVTLACGASPAEVLRGMLRRYPLPGVRAQVLPVANRYFGETVTVSGLITGRDLIAALRGAQTDEVLIPSCMLRSRQEEVFLDDVTLEQVRAETGLRVTPAGYDGEDLLLALAGGATQP
jgi:NifB/MoaA-like Fe-S oxidoreductase